jgi:hypothetical protein
VEIGTIVKSNSHISYMCRVYGPLETSDVPEPEAYAFGTFVALPVADRAGMRLVGVVRDTMLVNPEYGNLGPRLSPDRDLAVFSPDYLNEKGILVDILILGWDEGGNGYHAVPGLAAQVGTRVVTLQEQEVVSFHRSRTGRFAMGYLPLLMFENDPMLAGLLLEVLGRMESHFPEQKRLIGVLSNNLAWKARIAPAG